MAIFADSSLARELSQRAIPGSVSSTTPGFGNGQLHGVPRGYVACAGAYLKPTAYGEAIAAVMVYTSTGLPA